MNAGLSPALEQALAGAPVSQQRPTAAAAMALARETFRRGERLDMARLAEQLGVARTTLYRWTGDRDQLLTDVLWADTRSTLDALQRHIVAEHGRPATARVGAAFVDALAHYGPVRTLLRQEGQKAQLLLTVPSSTYRTRLAEMVVASIELDIAAGYVAPETPDLLADVLIAITERFLHNGGEPGTAPSPEMAKRAIAVLLRQ